MKYLVRTKKDGAFVDFQTAGEEYTHQYVEIEELPAKEGFYIQTYYDEESKTLKQKYVEIPKMEMQILKEEIEKLKKAQAEQIEPSANQLIGEEFGEI